MNKKRSIASGAAPSSEAVLYSDKPSRIAYWERRNRQKSHQRRRVSDEDYIQAYKVSRENGSAREEENERELPERRQFNDSYADLSPEAREIALAIDAYKIHFHRRYINHEELLMVLRSLGYKQEFSP